MKWNFVQPSSVMVLQCCAGTADETEDEQQKVVFHCYSGGWCTCRGGENVDELVMDVALDMVEEKALRAGGGGI